MYFSFQSVFHDWCNKGCGISPSNDGSRFPCYLNGLLPYVQCRITIKNVLSMSLNKTFPSFILLVSWQS